MWCCQYVIEGLTNKVNKKAAEKLHNEAVSKANNLNTEADKKANDLVAKAKAQGDQLIKAAQDKAK